MKQPYYDATDIDVFYSTGDMLEQVYDDRNLEDGEELDWETARKALDREE
jgi:hypothetical protein